MNSKSIYDIAKQAGVSIATVSRVVNKSPKVSEKTKQKVLEAIEQMDYTPNVFARGLGLNSMRAIGLLCPDVADPYMAQAVAHLEKKLKVNGYNCILGCSGEKEKEKERQVKLLLSKRIDALILIGSVYSEDKNASYRMEYIRDAAKQVPVFMINGRVGGEGIYCYYGDDYQGAYDVVRAMVTHGKKRILFLSDATTYSVRQKLAGYKAALREAKYPILEELRLDVKSDIQSVKEKMLAHDAIPFDSVFACNDILAIGALKYAKTKGIRVPEELEVVGYNNLLMASCCEPELTSVDNHLEQICENAVQGLMCVLQGETRGIGKQKFPCEIVKRNSTRF